MVQQVHVLSQQGDQLSDYYSCKIELCKLFKYIVFFLFNVTISIANILGKSYKMLATFKNIKRVPYLASKRVDK